MGGGKRKFNTIRKKFVPKEKQLGKFAEEEKKEHNAEDFKGLLDLWGSMKKKKEEHY